MRKLITYLLLCSFIISFGGNADAQFWKKKSKRHSHKNKKARQTNNGNVDSTKTDDDTYTPEEDDRMEVKEPKKTKSQLKKEKKERKKKEKEEKKKKKQADKKEKKEKKKHKGKEPAKPVADRQAKITRKWAEIDYPASQKKSHYRIDILAPMYLDELVKNGYAANNIPEKAVKGLDFYKGVQIAADTLKKAQFDIDIFVHDVASLLESSEMLIRKNLLDSSDLMIGAVPDKDVPGLAAYAKRRQINFVSTISASDGGVRDNQYFTMLQPSLKSYCEWVANTIENTVPKGKVLLLYTTTNPLDDNAYKYLTDEPNHRNMFFTLLCNTAPGKEAIAALIDSGQNNMVVASVHDTKYADSLLKILKKNFPGTHFDVYGMPSWNSYSAIYKQGAYPGFSFKQPVPFMFDEATAVTKYIDQVFKKEYGGKPSEMVYRGFETMFWYANMLKNYGTIFNKYYTDNEFAPLTKFEIKPQWDSQGNVIYQENRHLSLRKIENQVSAGNR